MRNSLQSLAICTFSLGAALAFLAAFPAEAGLERRPALAFPEVDRDADLSA